ADPGADGLPLLRRLEALALRRPLPARARWRALLHAAQDHHLALADRHPQGCRVRHADDAVAAVIASRRRSNPESGSRSWIASSASPPRNDEPRTTGQLRILRCGRPPQTAKFTRSSAAKAYDGGRTRETR